MTSDPNLCYNESIEDEGCAEDMQQLCWSCKKSIGKCPWSKSLTPVEGWEAVQVAFNVGDAASEPRTWLISNCPEYEPESICGRCEFFTGTEEEAILNIKKCEYSTCHTTLSSCSRFSNKFEREFVYQSMIHR